MTMPVSDTMATTVSLCIKSTVHLSQKVMFSGLFSQQCQIWIKVHVLIFKVIVHPPNNVCNQQLMNHNTYIIYISMLFVNYFYCLHIPKQVHIVAQISYSLQTFTKLFCFTTSNMFTAFDWYPLFYHSQVILREFTAVIEVKFDRSSITIFNYTQNGRGHMRRSLAYRLVNLRLQAQRMSKKGSNVVF